MTLGYDWHPSGRHTATVSLPPMPEKDDYRVRVISTWNPLHYDESDAPFTITGGAVRVHLPNGSETWRAGSQEFVHWQTSLPFAGTVVSLALRNAAGRVANLGESWASNGEGVELVTVPVVPTGSDYVVRAVSSWVPEFFDDSEAPFTILGTDSVAADSAADSANWAFYE
jgi:hypothetical protein